MMGLVAAVACYVYWGLIVMYWVALAQVDSQELLMHRVVWTFVLTLFVMGFRGTLREYLAAYRNRKVFWWHCLGAALLAANWYLFVYGVTHGRIADTSLGYFLCPFVTIFWGRVIEKEKLSRTQWVSIVLAGLGVARIAWSIGEVPVIATGIALTWGTFSIVKKRSNLGIFSGLGMEMSILTPFAIAYLLWFGVKGEIVWGTLGGSFDLLIASTGFVTMVPLLLYAYAVKRVSLTTMGLLQYVMPTIGLAIAVFVYEEPFGRERLVAFCSIWLGLALYAMDSFRNARKSRT
ncbi:MAG: EamA family transporter RarD [Opitutales bacterium]|nr:EamA family transporter RarD [Opitutales bacterium]